MSAQDEILMQRLAFRRERVEALISEIRNEGQTELPENRCKTFLQNLTAYNTKLDEELKYFTSTSVTPSLTHITETLHVQAEAEDLALELQSALSNFGSAQQSGPSTSKLPKLDLPKFDGNPTMWNEFWDRFESSVDTRGIAEADKMSYLQGCMEGSARGAIAGLSTTNANYSVAIRTLKDRFGDAQISIDAHYRALSNVPQADMSGLSCRCTLDMIEQHLRILEKLGEPSNGNHLRTLVLGKFPERVVHEVHIMCGDVNVSMERIREKLNVVVTAMERSSLLSSTNKLNDGPPEPATITTGSLLAPEARPKDKSRSRRPNKRKREPSQADGPKQDSKAEGPKPKKPRFPCLFCSLQNHYSADCKKVTTAEARKEKLKDRCLRCLGRHQTCTKKRHCFRCKGDHLHVLCPEVLSDRTGKENVICMEPEIKSLSINGSTFLQTAVAVLRNESTNKQRTSRLLLDCGSQRSYITQRAAKSLGLTSDKEDHLLVYTFGAAKPKQITSPTTTVTIETKREICRSVHVNIVPTITDRVPVANFDYEVDVHADDGTVGENVDLLIGNDYFCTFLRDDKMQISTNLFLIDSDFGWILSGCEAEAPTQTNALSVTTYCRCHESSCPYFTQPDLPLRNVDIQFLWSLESIGITDSPKATHQEEAVRHFNETVKFNDGRYEVKWPWVDQNPDLPTNFGLALGRLKGLIKRLDKNTIDEYNSILQEQKESSVIEECEPHNSQDFSHLIHYLPHHMVKQPGKKGRIVYDASAKSSGKSLNECLYSGPSMLEDLTGLILKCRANRIGIMADVEKAFLQVGLQNEDRDVTRFLWLKDPYGEPTADNLLHLRFCRVAFGIISSPFLLTATIRHHLSQSNEKLLKSIADRCYVDNLVTGADSILQAKEIYSQTRTAFDQISMNIRDWVSNDKEFLDSIPEQYRTKETEKAKMLGLIWNFDSDTLQLNISTNHFLLQTCDATKREVLRILSRIYDPCGFVCPMVLPIKLLFQEICDRKLKWDEKLPEDLTSKLKNFLEQMKAIMEVKLPRYIGTTVPHLDTQYELHCFTDASKDAYAAVVYLTSTNAEERTVSFVMAKTHVSRVEDKTDLKIPRLELLGFLIGSRLLTYTESNLELPILKKYLWTDSQVVLSWIKSDKLLPPFVARRIAEIKQRHPHTAMLHVSGKMNPADVATRQELGPVRQELWFNGPDFLKQGKDHWPVGTCSLLSAWEAPAVDQPTDTDVVTLDTETQTLTEGYPEDTEMVVPDANTLPPDVEMSASTSTADENILKIKQLQEKYFPDEVRGKETHLSRNLDLYVDVDGVLRCGGRMANTDWSYDMKHPILLPKDSEFTNEVIRKVHEENYHVGAVHTLSLIRKHYWIPQGKVQVLKLIRRCPKCVKHGGGPYKLPQAPDLPPERVNYTEPFTYTGVDYFGPMFIQSNGKPEKRWVALFTCLSVRAIHLELVKDLTAQECLLALRRCIATHGVPKRIYSDNATYFKLTSEVVGSSYCIEKKITWKFIPQLAPWHGGFYERLVALVKHCLKRTLDKQLLNENALNTILKEVQAVVNTRPLTTSGIMSADGEVTHILRPCYFLSLGKCLTTEPASVDNPCEGTSQKIDLIASWRRGLRIVDEFKSMFIGQYLTSLRERYRHSPKQPRVLSDKTPQVGDCVQIKSDSKNRCNWQVGMITHLLRGADGECRVAKVQIGNKSLTRSIGHLYPLEMDDCQDSTRTPPTQQTRRRYFEPMYVYPELDTLREQILHGFDKLLNPSHTQGEQVSQDFETSPVPPDEEIQVQAETPDEGVLTSSERSEPEPSDNAAAHNAEETRETHSMRREAAVRAREKILEWTRQLLTRLE